MSRVLFLHGIGQQLKGEDSLAREWALPLRDGMRRSGCTEAQLPGDGEILCSFYGDLFRPAGRRLGIGDPWLTAADATEFEQELLASWWRGAAESDPRVVHPNAKTLARTPGSVQAALRALSGSAFFAGLAERAMLSDLQQVRRYMTDAEVRRAVQDRMVAEVAEDTRVVVGHSLGSVVAYEALCAHPEWPVRTLVTLGSPLGMPGSPGALLHRGPLRTAHARSRARGPSKPLGRFSLSAASRCFSPSGAGSCSGGRCRVRGVSGCCCARHWACRGGPGSPP